MLIDLSYEVFFTSVLKIGVVVSVVIGLIILLNIVLDKRKDG